MNIFTPISKTGGYTVYLEVIPANYPDDSVCVQFCTTWADSKNPTEFHEKFSMILTLDQLQYMSEVLNTYIQRG